MTLRSCTLIPHWDDDDWSADSGIPGDIVWMKTKKKGRDRRIAVRDDEQVVVRNAHPPRSTAKCSTNAKTPRSPVALPPTIAPPGR